MNDIRAGLDTNLQFTPNQRRRITAASHLRQLKSVTLHQGRQRRCCYTPLCFADFFKVSVGILASSNGLPSKLSTNSSQIMFVCC